MNPHTALCNRILAAVSRTASRLFLNPVGVGVVGKVERINRAGSVYLQAGDYVVRFGQRIDYGLTPGSADIIGITPRIVTAEDVGRTLGIFTSIEVKTGSGRLQQNQIQWGTFVTSNGGIAVEARSEQDALDAIALATGELGKPVSASSKTPAFGVTAHSPAA